MHRCSFRLTFWFGPALLGMFWSGRLVSGFSATIRPRQIQQRLDVLSMSASSSITATAAAATTSKSIRCLGLHGSGGNKDEFFKTVKHALGGTYDNCSIVTIDAPFPKEGGFCWWTMPPGTRSFNADEYIGFEQSANTVLEALGVPSQQDDESGTAVDGTFDLVFGHSQGAILLSALLATNRIPQHPRLGYILNGVAWPNPYSLELGRLQFIGDTNQDVPRILFLTGIKDTINPPEGAKRVLDCLESAGATVQQHIHPAGHSVPVTDEDSMDAIKQWLQQA